MEPACQYTRITVDAREFSSDIKHKVAVHTESTIDDVITHKVWSADESKHKQISRDIGLLHEYALQEVYYVIFYLTTNETSYKYEFGKHKFGTNVNIVVKDGMFDPVVRVNGRSVSKRTILAKKVTSDTVDKGSNDANHSWFWCGLFPSGTRNKIE
jgi:hypothetical protein